jgi:hypothetical protein
MLAHSPSIITSNLVLCLDAANTKSILSAVEVLVVAGGGGGGMDMGGGGGGGGVIYSSAVSITPGSAITATVGNGGVGAPAGSTNGQPGVHQFTISATQGGNSVFGELTAIGGGYGGSSYWGYTPNNGYGGTGGSGGGASGYKQGVGSNGRGGTGTSGQGFNGGGAVDNYYSGGGGGAGDAGVSGPSKPNGGPGVIYPSMSPYYFGGGGGGASYSLSTGGDGGNGGGGGGALGTTVGGSGLNPGSPGGGGSPNSQTNTPGGNAGANTGGGGGGGSHYNANNKGGDGGSGIIIVRYPGSQRASGGTVTFVAGHTIHTFTTSGTFTPNGAPGTGTIWTDFSNNGNSGTLTNGPTYSSANGGSLVFDGSNDYIQTPLSGTFPQITFEFWGFFDDPNLNMLLRNESAFGDWTSSRVHFGTRWTGSNAGMHFNVNAVWQTTPPTNLRYGWNHYVLVYDTVNNLKRVYLNNILSSSHATNGNMVLGDFRIGVAINLNQYYRGNISNFKVYNRALSAAEIQQNYNATKSRYI